MEPALTTVDILGILPHRYPFLMIDKVLSLEHSPGKSRVGSKIVCVKNVTANEEFFSGHFPNYPIMPGVMQLEVMAQAAALAVFRKTDPPKDFFMAGVQDVRFRKPVVPGDTLTVYAEIIKDRNLQMIVSKCEIKVDNQMVSEATVLAAISDRQSREN